MTKAQVLLYCREKAKYEGWMTHEMLLDIFNDKEDIPEFIIDLVCYKPEPPKPLTLYWGSKGYALFEKALEDYGMYLTQVDIIEDFKKQYKP